ncbi:EcoAI/FtnUII family type I restriction enzme subunit R [Bacillus pseudomycoides]|uniref:EcoAI/FtnUII family type I restriction enzme subunit R n=1 Tax=Bacillus pseudomycoides TaxID=64104 RepID=UPI000BFE1E96|nr:DEAD/DEAH box helicase family protein [Bacillus pseudomycoides]PHE54663.1 restriction endonuclease [Bacillus pseudomycoides]
MNKKNLSERDICSKFITPAVVNAGWDLQKQIREEVTFTDGRIFVRKKKVTRGKKKRADYILYYKPNIPIAIIEAKDNKHSVGAGMQQALEYGEILDIPFIYSSNGDAFIEHDRTVTEGVKEKDIALNDFPSPESLWKRYKEVKGITEEAEQTITQDFHFEHGGKSPRYYQRVAINRTVEAIAKGQDRVLLVMATGTGKTYTAFQIIHRLWKARTKKRILFLADRNILVDQTMSNDFRHFGDKMTKITNRTVDKAHEIYLALYQGISGKEEFQNVYKEFSPDFFDLIVIDECHRGSAKEDSAWREILDYFSPAAQVGLTATPKETKDVSNIEYFGEPIYTYSLKQGIEDGFLAPYKVIRVALDKDLGYRPTKGKRDKYGYEIEDREYSVKDFDKKLVLEQRTKMIAKKVSDYLKENGNRFAKTIFFCTDIDHAERMRQALVNENSDLVAMNSKYVMRITGDNEEGKKELDSFIDPACKYPTLVTTSKLLTTGVDCQTCQLIVLDTNISSMIEFKQIIGRGTRIREDYGKQFFTILDFRNVTAHFADPTFDGDPVVIKTTDGKVPTDDEDEPIDSDDNTGGSSVSGDDGGNVDWPNPDEGDKPKKYYINDVEVRVIHERVMYYGKDGKLVTESLIDYTKKSVRSYYHTLDEFLEEWNATEKKKAVIEVLEEQGILFEELQEEVGKELDPFDLICHIAFDMPPLTRKERANNVKKRNYFAKYSETARAVLEVILDKYADEGIDNLDKEVLRIPDFREFGTPIQIAREFGGTNSFILAMKELQQEIYTA